MKNTNRHYSRPETNVMPLMSISVLQSNSSVGNKPEEYTIPGDNTGD